MEYYSTLKINELSSPEKTWRDYIYILLSEKIQSEKSTYCMISNYGILEKQNYKDSKKIHGCWVGRGGRVGRDEQAESGKAGSCATGGSQ